MAVETTRASLRPSDQRHWLLQELQVHMAIGTADHPLEPHEYLTGGGAVGVRQAARRAGAGNAPSGNATGDVGVRDRTLVADGVNVRDIVLGQQVARTSPPGLPRDKVTVLLTSQARVRRRVTGSAEVAHLARRAVWAAGIARVRAGHRARRAALADADRVAGQWVDREVRGRDASRRRRAL